MLQSDWSKFTNSPNCSSFWPEVSCQPALRRFGLVPLRWSTMFETTAAHGIFSSSDLTGPSASVGITAALIQFTFKAAPGWRLKGNCSRAETCVHHSIRDRGATHDRWTLRLRRWCFALTASQSWWMMSFYRAAADRIIIIMSLYYYYLPYYVLAVFICIAKCPWVTFKGAYKSK